MKNTPENIVKKEVRDWLDIKGWYRFHLLQGLGSYPGLSDMVACKDGIVLFIECKAKGKHQSPKQEDFESELKAQGCHYVLAYGYEDVEKYLRTLNVNWK